MRHPWLPIMFVAAVAFGPCGCSLFTRYSVTVTVDPSAGGTVTMDPEKRRYCSGDTVTLTAEPADGYGFAGYEGDLVSSERACDITVEGDMAITAAFQANEIGSSYTASGSQGFLVGATDVDEIRYTLSLGTAARDVYFIFTNVGEDAADAPTVTEQSGDFGSLVGSVASRSIAAERMSTGGSGKRAIRGIPEADAFYPEAEARIRSMPRGRSRDVTARAAEDVSSTCDFYFQSTSSPIEATCRVKVAVGDKTLLVWVADDQWGTVTQDMVDKLADQFLSSSGDRIYDWISTIFGEEWEDTEYSYLIADDDTISILLYDIYSDGTEFVDDGGYVGFFYAKDNFVTSAYDYSNQRIMFYLDAPMLAYTADDEVSWDITNYWPEEVVSTLAHEFQHMIHFYQKYVKRGGSLVTWLNEMCSMVAEDLVSDKLEVQGPRGVSPVDYEDGTAGAAANDEGYLPMYVYWNDIPVAYWPSSSSDTATLLLSYSVNYAFGAYLARNFGGATLFQDIVQSAYADRDAVTQALVAAGHSEDFASALRKWGIANLLSDSTDTASGYVYNADGWIDASTDSDVYSLGSINLYNYRYSFGSGGYHDGPYIYSSIPTEEAIDASSNVYYQAASGATGDLVWDITLGGDTRLEVVVKEPQ